MKKIARALGAAAKAAAEHYSTRDSRPKGDRISIAGRAVACPHCHGDRFETSQARLKSAFLPSGDFSLLDQTVTVVLCMTCSGIHWFAAKPETFD